MTQSDSIIGEPIAVLVDGRHVRCLTCSKSRITSGREANLYKVNIEPYEQRCHECDSLITESTWTSPWPTKPHTLFEQEGCKNCLCCLCGLGSPVDATVHKGCSDHEMAMIDAEGASMEELMAAGEMYEDLRRNR